MELFDSDYILITNLMHWLLFIHKILFFSTCFEPQVLIFRRIQLYTCSIWYCHSLWEFLAACRYTAWVRTDCRGKVVGGCLKTPTNNLPPTAERTQCAQWAHTVRSASVPTPHNRSQHIQANTTRGFIQSVLLTMGIIMPETCCVNLLWINIYTCVICWFFLLLQLIHFSSRVNKMSHQM